MTVSLALLVTMAVLYACGVYLLLEKSMTRVIIGFLLIGNATNILLLIVSGPAGQAAIVDGEFPVESFSDPLPQALILTAIVITFAVSAFLMALVYRSWRLANEDALTVDPDDVALRTRLADEPEMPDADEDDTEFGIRADAAVAGATDLDVRPSQSEGVTTDSGRGEAADAETGTEVGTAEAARDDSAEGTPSSDDDQGGRQS